MCTAVARRSANKGTSRVTSEIHNPQIRPSQPYNCPWLQQVWMDGESIKQEKYKTEKGQEKKPSQTESKGGLRWLRLHPGWNSAAAAATVLWLR